MRYRIALHQRTKASLFLFRDNRDVGLKAQPNPTPLKTSRTPFGSISQWLMNSFGMSRFVR